MQHVAYSLVWINILAFFVAWPFAKIINSFVFIILCGVIFYVGSLMFAEWYSLGVFLFLCPFGYLLRKYDVMPLVFLYILHDRFLMNGHTIIDLFNTL